MKPWGPQDRQLLDALRVVDEPTPRDRDRVRARVMQRVALGAGVAASVTTSSAVATATQSTLVATLVKVGLVVAGVGVGGVTLFWVTRHEATPAPVATAASVAPAPVRAAPPPPVASAAPAASMVMSPHPAARAHSAPMPSTGDLEQELGLLEQAQQAMRQGDSQRALRLLERHAAEHPTGALAEERAMAHAIALCQSGDQVRGQAEARRLLGARPRSPLADRLRAACRLRGP